jgi:hypothetical protein
MRNLIYFVTFGAFFFLAGCDESTPSTEQEPQEAAPEESKEKVLELTPFQLPSEAGENPAADGFDLAGSDETAIAIADSIMKYHGGRTAWDNSRFLQWNFFGLRKHYWDKQESRVRIEVPSQNMVYLLDFSSGEPAGRVRKLGDEITNQDSLDYYLGRAFSMWINDSYWLVQQFKLKDSGVTLKYSGDVRLDPLMNRPSYIIDQTFSEVGDTPGNRYRLYVDKTNYRINTWEFYRNATDQEPGIQTPWGDYKPYNGIMLSADRGGRFQLSGISVSEQMPDRVFEEF